MKNAGVLDSALTSFLIELTRNLKLPKQLVYFSSNVVNDPEQNKNIQIYLGIFIYIVL